MATKKKQAKEFRKITKTIPRIAGERGYVSNPARQLKRDTQRKEKSEETKQKSGKNLLAEIVKKRYWYGKHFLKQNAYAIKKQVEAGTISQTVINSTLIKLGYGIEFTKQVTE